MSEIAPSHVITLSQTAFWAIMDEGMEEATQKVANAKAETDNADRFMYWQHRNAREIAEFLDLAIDYRLGDDDSYVAAYRLKYPDWETWIHRFEDEWHPKGAS